MERTKQELLEENSRLRKALQAIYDHDDGAWAAGKYWKQAEKMGRESMRDIAVKALSYDE